MDVYYSYLKLLFDLSLTVFWIQTFYWNVYSKLHLKLCFFSGRNLFHIYSYFTSLNLLQKILSCIRFFKEPAFDFIVLLMINKGSPASVCVSVCSLEWRVLVLHFISHYLGEQPWFHSLFTQFTIASSIRKLSSIWRT